MYLTLAGTRGVGSSRLWKKVVKLIERKKSFISSYVLKWFWQLEHGK